MPDDDEWTLYVKPGCPWCTEAIAYLREHKYLFEIADVIRDPQDFAEMKRLSGQTLTPTLAIGEELVLPDFDTGQLEEFLDENGLIKA